MPLGSDSPLTVISLTPAVAAPVLPTVMTLAPGGTTGLTLKPTVVPAGSPDADSVTGSLNP